MKRHGCETADERTRLERKPQMDADHQTRALQRRACQAGPLKAGLLRLCVNPRLLSPCLRSIAIAVMFACTALGGESLRAGEVTVEFAPSDRSRAEVVPAIIAHARAEIERGLGLLAPAKITVRLLRMKEAFLGVSGGKPVELYAGRAFPASGTIHVNMTALDREGRALAFPRTVRHEFVHLAVGHTLGGRKLPKWFEEGLACAFGSPLPRADADVLQIGRAFRLRELRVFPRGKEAMRLAYAQSDSVLRFLVGKRGTAAVKEVLRRTGAGERFEEALASATGYDTDSLDAAWRRSLSSRWGWWLVRFVFSPSRLLLWAALLAVIAFFVVRRRRRLQAEALDEYP